MSQTEPHPTRLSPARACDILHERGAGPENWLQPDRAGSFRALT
jgi:hypothetical protein